MSARTTILGVVYRGRPMMNSLACRIWLLEQKGKAAEAQALLDAHNRIRSAFGNPPVDLTADMTEIPTEGMQTYPAKPLIDRVVVKTARAA